MKLSQRLHYFLLALTLFLTVALVLSACGSKTKGPDFLLDQDKDGAIIVTTDHAKADSGGLGYLTIAEGQRMAVDAKLEGNSSLRIQVAPGRGDDINQPPIDLGNESGSSPDYLLDETVSGTKLYSFELEPNDYIVQVTTTGPATGTIRIFTEGEAASPADTAENDKENEDSTADLTLANPIVEVTEKQQMELFGLTLNAPENATDIVRKVILADGSDEPIAAVSFNYDDRHFEYRCQNTDELAAVDISGLYYNWTDEQTGEVHGHEATIRTCDEAGCILWLDTVPGLTYSLGCTDTIDAALLSEIANLIFQPTQGDA